MLTACMTLALIGQNAEADYDRFMVLWPKQVKVVERKVRGKGMIEEWTTGRAIPRVLTIRESQPTGQTAMARLIRAEMASQSQTFLRQYQSSPSSNSDFLTHVLTPSFLGTNHASLVRQRTDNTTLFNHEGFRIQSFIKSGSKLKSVSLGGILLPGAANSIEDLLYRRAGLIQAEEMQKHNEGWQASSDYWAFSSTGIYFIAAGYRRKGAYFLTWQELKPYLNLAAEPMRLPITKDGRSVSQLLAEPKKTQAPSQWAKITTASLAEPKRLPWPFDLVETPVNEPAIKKLGFTKVSDGGWYGKSERNSFFSEDEKITTVLGDLWMKRIEPLGLEIQLKPKSASDRSIVLKDTLKPRNLAVTLNSDLTLDLWIDFPRRASSQSDFALMQYRWDGKGFRRLKQWTAKDFNLKFVMGVGFLDMDEDGAKEMILLGSSSDDSSADKSCFYSLQKGSPVQIGKVEGSHAGGISMDAWGGFESRLTMLDKSGAVITVLDEYEMPNKRYGSHLYRVTMKGAEKIATTKSTIAATLPGTSGRLPTVLAHQVELYGDGQDLGPTPCFLWEFKPR